MDTITTGRETVHRGIGGFQSGVFGKMQKFFALSRAERQLQQLDDRMLSDIGITRGEISKMVWGS